MSSDATEIARTPAPMAECERRTCIECGADFDPEFSKDGEYCFTCSVHVACSCADRSD